MGVCSENRFPKRSSGTVKLVLAHVMPGRTWFTAVELGVASLKQLEKQKAERQDSRKVVKQC